MPKTLPPLIISDLLRQGVNNDWFEIIGRKQIYQQFTGVLARRNHNNIIMVGKRGVGKSSVITGLVRNITKGTYKNMDALPFIQLNVSNYLYWLHEANDKEAYLKHAQKAFESLPSCVLIIDDADLLLDELDNAQQFRQLFHVFFISAQKRLVLLLEEETWQETKTKYDRYLKSFDILNLEELKENRILKILKERVPLLTKQYQILIDSNVPQTILEASRQLTSGRAMPDRAIRFFDELCATQSHLKKITVNCVQELLDNKLKMPTVKTMNHDRLSKIDKIIKKQVIGQDQAVNVIAKTIQRGWLKLKNPNRPIGSFLFLGPSGVGKTELAKVLAKTMFGSEKSMIRIDMSEYAEAHNVQRLLGAPPGYIGYEAGGQLTSPVSTSPNSLILLDEIEKADPSVFNIFLQVLDDGRLTDGQGKTIDFSKTIIIATSNIGVPLIVDGWQKKIDITDSSWIQTNLLPEISKHLRPELINRFEGIITFNPLSTDALVDVAKLEIRKLEKRLKHHHVKVNFSAKELRNKVIDLADPRFGARPIKRFVEQACETALAAELLKNDL